MKKSITEILGIKYPLVQGPMSWLTNAEFVASVSNAGGLGVFGPNAGQTTLTHSPVETAERMRREIQKTRGLTDKPYQLS
ncbi:nitronate monooxygenase [uncultured Tolumonas sp.]|uniref:nitronate monooxygenase n=1 Tax=uncultured Tolumonas sp. TaxID=263765 RepID=UPI002A0A39C4|nr:nitronate monooxygenase [uncultured Tolumonas sp.]